MKFLILFLFAAFALGESQQSSNSTITSNLEKKMKDVKRQLTTSQAILLVSPLKKNMYPTPFYKSQDQQPFEEPHSVFFIRNQSAVDIIIDLRHIKNFTNYTGQFIYGQQWDIAIALFTDDTYSTQNILDMPEIFTRNETDKLNSHEFSLFAYRDIYLSVYLRILNSSYTNLRSAFAQTTSIQVVVPQRAVLGENLLFAFVLFNNGVVNLPVAMPTLSISNPYPDSILTYTPISTKDSTELLTPINITSVQRIYTYQVNSDKFWGSQSQISVPFIPFASNCKNFGEYLFLHDIIENKNFCTLQSYNETITVKQFEFLKVPTSDTCTSVQFDCIMDEAFFTANSLPKFYEVAVNTPIFYMTADPVNFVTDIILPNTQYQATNLIQVITLNSVPSSQLPKQVHFHLEYFQVDKVRKRIVKAYFKFDQLIDKTKVTLTDPFEIQFLLTLHSMNHAELAIAFALDIPIYVILSMIIGIFSVAMIFMYYCFFKLSNIFIRRRDLEAQPFKFKNIGKELLQYLMPYKPICIGIFLGYIPNFIIFFLLSFLMLGGFWGIPFLSTCPTPNSENICETSILEGFGSDPIAQDIRRGRLGMALLLVGFYSCIRIAQCFVPASSEDKKMQQVNKAYENNYKLKKENNIFSVLIRLKDKVDFFITESYDGNIWNEKIWLQGLFIFMNIYIIILMVLVIYLSYSVQYGVYIWIWTFILKIAQIIIEECLKFYVENELLLSTLSCVITISLAVSGLGAIDFFDYLQNTFINLGISTFEKTNQVLVVDIVSDFIKDVSSAILNWMIKTFKFDDDNDDEDEDQDEDQILKKNKNKKSNDGDGGNSEIDQKGDVGNSSIFLTDNYEESIGSVEFEANWFSEQNEKDLPTGKQKEAAKGGKQRTGKKSPSSKEKKLFEIEQDEQKDLNKINNEWIELPSQLINEIDIAKQNLIAQEMIEETDSFIESNFQEDILEQAFRELIDQKMGKKTMTLAQRQQSKGKINEDEVDSESEHKSNQLKIYGDFCNNSFNMICAPGQVLSLWMFYYPNQMFVSWGITLKGLVFYYLFLILNIPFQIFMDILFLKTVEEFHHIHTTGYFKYVKEKFEKRKLSWMVDDEKIDEGDIYVNQIEPDLQFIHRWCYSSQFFFCLSIFVGGSISIIEGILIITVNSYNLFRDTIGIVYITLIWMSICKIIDVFCVKFCSHRIWRVKGQKQPLKRSDPPLQSEKVEKQNKFISAIENIKSNEQSQVIPDIRTKNNSFTKIMGWKFKGNDNNKSNDIPMSGLIDGSTVMNRTAVFGENLIKLNTSRKGKLNGEETKNVNFSLNNSQTNVNQSNNANNISQMINNYSSAYKDNNSHTIHTNNQITENDFYTRLAEVSDYGDKEEIQEIYKLLCSSREIRLFFEEQIKDIKDYDIGVQTFILDFTSSKKEDQKFFNNFLKREKLLDLFLYNFQKNKLLSDPHQEFQKLARIDFSKAIQEKERKSKYQDIKSHFIDNEYKDNKFLKTFLRVNRQWLRKSTRIFFDDLLRGESHYQLKNFRKLILNTFGEIYGELKSEGPSQEIIVKNVTIKKYQPLKIDVIQYENSWIHQLLKYWKHRSAIQKAVTSLVGGYFLKGEKKECQYCKTNWGITVQSKVNVEELFNSFYKSECINLGFQFNVIELFENDLLIANHQMQSHQEKATQNNQYSDQIPLVQSPSQSPTSKRGMKSSQFLAQYLEIPKQVSQRSAILVSSKKQVMLSNLKNNEKESELDEEIEEQGEESIQYQIHGEGDKGFASQGRIRREQVYNIERQLDPKDLIKRSKILKQKIIGRWQEYFLQHANIVSICFQCNEQAHDKFHKEIVEQRRIKREIEFEKERIKAIQLKEQQQLMMEMESDNENEDDEDGDSYNESDDLNSDSYQQKQYFKKNNAGPQSNNNNNKSPGEDVNPIIEEENNEDQSQGDERLSRFEDRLSNMIIMPNPITRNCSQGSSDEHNSESDEVSLEEGIRRKYIRKDDLIGEGDLKEQRKSFKSIKSLMSNKSAVSKTHPSNKNDEEIDNISEEYSEGTKEKVAERLNQQLLFQNNTSFKVKSVSKKQSIVPFFQDFDDNNNQNDHNNEEDYNMKKDTHLEKDITKSNSSNNSSQGDTNNNNNNIINNKEQIESNVNINLNNRRRTQIKKVEADNNNDNFSNFMTFRNQNENINDQIEDQEQIQFSATNNQNNNRDESLEESVFSGHSALPLNQINDTEDNILSNRPREKN